MKLLQIGIIVSSWVTTTFADVSTNCPGNEVPYVGCFVDDGQRDLKNFIGSGYNQVACNSACQDYTYFSLQYYGYCFCGNAYSTKPQYVKKPDNECGGARGNGRAWRNSVYKTCHDIQDKSATCLGKEESYIGCYVDDAQRDLDKFMGSGYNQLSCNSACQDSTYFSLQYYGQCFCGNDYSTKPQYVKKPDSECGGARGQGTAWRNSVYKTCYDIEGSCPDNEERNRCFPDGTCKCAKADGSAGNGLTQGSCPDNDERNRCFPDGTCKCAKSDGSAGDGTTSGTCSDVNKRCKTSGECKCQQVDGVDADGDGSTQGTCPDGLQCQANGECRP